MKYIKQVLIITVVTLLSELIKYVLPFPIPASIYGLIIMFVLLLSNRIQVHQVKDVSSFLIKAMPIMFIPAGVGIMTTWDQFQAILIPISVIVMISTLAVMIVSGKVTDLLLKGDQHE